jgi:hypothetical protein
MVFHTRSMDAGNASNKPTRPTIASVDKDTMLKAFPFTATANRRWRFGVLSTSSAVLWEELLVSYIHPSMVCSIRVPFAQRPAGYLVYSDFGFCQSDGGIFSTLAQSSRGRRRRKRETGFLVGLTYRPFYEATTSIAW